MMESPRFDTARSHFWAGRLAEAEAACREILEHSPDHTEALSMLAMLAQKSGRTEDAAILFRRAVALIPGEAAYHYNLANALKALGHYDQAIESYRAAVALRPELAEAHFNLANTLKATGRLEEAIVAYRCAVTVRPDHAGTFNNFASALRDSGRLDEAIHVAQQAIAVQPGLAEAHNNLGNLLSDRGEVEAAIQVFQKTLNLRPNYVEALNNLGNAHRALAQWDAAESSYRRALALQPDSTQTRWNLSMVLLVRGNFAEGFAAYESRLKLPTSSVRRDFKQPKWDGSELNGKTILLHAEQGMGDAIQFVRYATMVAARGGRVIVMCHEPLRKLFQGQPGIQTVIGFDEATPAFDVQCPLMSLPSVFRTTLQSIPASIAYLTVDAAASERWGKPLQGLGNGLKIGLAWAGNPANPKDRLRSISLKQLAPLFATHGCDFISLQKRAASEPALVPPAGMELVDWSGELNDFVDTAALIAALDLVISVDTAVAHLAGALGKPVWLLVPAAPDWRWLLSRRDSPWYPTMRLFRQKDPANWNAPITDISEELRKLQAPKHP